MPNLPDTDLDELLKQAYEKYDMGKQTNSWESLASVLDEHLPQKKDRRRGFFFLLLLFLLAGGASLLIFTGDVHHRAPLASRTAESRTAESPNAVNHTATSPTAENHTVVNPNATSPTTENRAAESHTTGSSISVNHTIGNPTATSPTAENLIAENRIAENHIAKNHTAKNHVDVSPTRRNSTRQHHRSTRPSIDNEIQADPALSTTTDASAPPSTSAPSGVIALPVSSRALALPAPSAVSTPLATLTGPPPPIVAKKAPVQDSALANNKSNKKTTQPKTKFFELGVLAGEDESNVRFKTNSRAGFNIGLLAGYSFSKNWSVTSGITYTWKNYMANGKDYHAPKDHFVNSPGVVLQEAASTCSMLDIPINVKYSWAVNPNAKLFLSTGISSYLMLREVYTFYGTDSGTAFKRGLDGDEVLKKGFWFSVLNLSVGYEKSISPRLSFQVEPYVKIPLQGIGFGKVLMNSYGINFAIKMRY